MAELPRVGDLTLHVVTETNAASSAIYLWFHVGSVDEEADEHGAAHFLEHLLFKGTERLDVGEAAARIEGMGGDLNAWTSCDEMVLHASVAAGDTLAALDVLLDMASGPRFDPVHVERERQVILDEIRGYADDSETVASDALQASLFAGHGYGRPVLGTAETVAGLTVDQLQAFHRRHLHPARGALLVTGPLPESEVRQRTLPWLASWAAGAPRRPLPSPPVAQGAFRRLANDLGGATVQLGFHAPPHGHEAWPALEVLAACLGHGAASLLPQALELDTGVASGCWASATGLLAAGTFELGFQVGRTEEAVPLALSLIDEVVADGIDGERVARAIDGLGADLQFGLETVDGRTANRAFHLAAHGDPSYAERHRRHVAAVTPSEVHAAAREWLSAERRHLVVLDPEVPAGQVRTWGRHRPRPSVVRRPDGPEVLELEGLTAVLLPDGSPLAAIQVHVPGGQALEPPRVAGLARAWAGGLPRGAAARDAHGFAARLDELAMVLDGHPGRASLALTGSLPADRLGLGLELVADALLDPHFDPVDIDHVVEEMLDDEAALHDRAAAIAQNALHQALFPGHPWGRPPGGMPSTIERIRSATVRRLHERAVVRGNVWVAVAGGVQHRKVRQQLEALAEALPDRPPPALPEPTTPPQAVRRREGGRSQGAVVLGLRAAGAGPEHRRALGVLAALLDSQSGRLFMELREERGLAYGLWCTADLPVAASMGSFGLGLTMDPSRADEAREALSASWARLAKEGPTEEEVQRTTRMLAGHVALGRERVTVRARAMLRHALGLGPYHLHEVQRALLAIDRHAVRDAIASLEGPPLVALALPP